MFGFGDFFLGLSAKKTCSYSKESFSDATPERRLWLTIRTKGAERRYYTSYTFVTIRDTVRAAIGFCIGYL